MTQSQKVVTVLQEAALDDALWPRASAQIDEACGLEGNALVVGEGFGDDAKVYFHNFYFRGERREDLEREYFALYHPQDERLPRLRRLRPGQVVPVRELYAREELATSRVYNEGLPRLGSQNGLLARLDGPDGLRIVWALGDPVRPGGWERAQLETVRSLLGPIRQFVRVRHALAGAQALGDSLSGLLENPRIGVIHLGQDGRVLEANARALGLLRLGDGLVDRDGSLSARLPSDDERLQRLLAAALPDLHGRAAGGSMTVSRRSGPKLVLHVNPVKGRYPDFGAGRVAALLLLTDPNSRPSLDAGAVSRVLGLTPAESQVTVMLCEGKTPGAIARLTGRRLGTVYILTKRAYRKLGVSRQADLVRVLLQFSDVPAYLD